MGLQRVGHDWVTELNWTELIPEGESEVAQSCLTLCDPMGHSLPGFSVHGIFQARILEWVAISFSRRSSWRRDWTQVSYIVGKCFTIWAIREAQKKVKVAKLCPTLCDPKDCSLPGSSVHEILQSRILEWVAFPFSRGSSQLRDWTQVSYIVGRFFTSWATVEASWWVLSITLLACEMNAIVW